MLPAAFLTPVLWLDENFLWMLNQKWWGKLWMSTHPVHIQSFIIIHCNCKPYVQNLQNRFLSTILSIYLIFKVTCFLRPVELQHRHWVALTSSTVRESHHSECVFSSSFVFVVFVTLRSRLLRVVKGTPRVHGEHPTPPPPPPTTWWCYESIVTNEKWWLDARLLVQRQAGQAATAGPHRDWNFEVVSEARGRVPIGGDLVREGDINEMGSMQSVFWQILPVHCTSYDVSWKWIKVSLMSEKSGFHVTRTPFPHFSRQSMSLQGPTAKLKKWILCTNNNRTPIKTSGDGRNQIEWQCGRQYQQTTRPRLNLTNSRRLLMSWWLSSAQSD